jgi:hypothetical protein
LVGIAAAVADANSQQLSVLLGNGDGTFLPLFSYPTGAAASFVTVGDLDGDGHLDLISATPPVVLKGKGDGTFVQTAPILFGSSAITITTGLFNGDKKPDLAVANGGGVTILLNAN